MAAWLQFVNEQERPMMRLVTIVVICGLAVGCGGSTPTSPTATAATAPQFPSMTGGWSGTRSMTLIERGGLNRRDSNLCTETWIVTAQTDGRFSGTFQASGGTSTPCSQSGTLGGEVSTAGGVSNLIFSDPAPQTGL